MRRIRSSTTVRLSRRRWRHYWRSVSVPVALRLPTYSRPWDPTMCCKLPLSTGGNTLPFLKLQWQAHENSLATWFFGEGTDCVRGYSQINQAVSHLSFSLLRFIRPILVELSSDSCCRFVRQLSDDNSTAVGRISFSKQEFKMQYCRNCCLNRECSKWETTVAHPCWDRMNKVFKKIKGVSPSEYVLL